ncbi:MAG: AhpC/TSA family protein [Mangrovimonas sp.]|nr:AhpC/TSA family protein [Mangrovimonas sp.]HPF96918.1 peroxiredoxin-like family protein [Mangrovimonas sp.]
MKTISLLLFMFVSSLVFSQVPENPEDVSPLLVGEKIPEAMITNLNGDDVSLQQILKEKPTVLVFYRGGWCPYCNNQLSGLAEIENEVLSEGFQIVAISPDNHQMLSKTMTKDEINYQLYSDKEAKLIQAVGIGFKTPESNKKYIFNKTNFEPSEILPVPTVMILNTKGEIVFEYINPNYKVRLDEKLLLAVLKAI